MKTALTYLFFIALYLAPVVGHGQLFNSKKYTLENSTAEGDILQIQQDQGGAIWWVNDEYFTRFNGITFSPVQYGTLATGYQYSLPYIDAHGDLWLCLSSASKTDVYTYNTQKKVWELVTTLVLTAEEKVNSFYASRISGSPWLVLATGSRVLSLINNEWEEIQLEDTSPIKKIAGASNELYILTNEGLYRAAQGQKAVLVPLPLTLITTVKEISIYENIWVNGGKPHLWVLGQYEAGHVQAGIYHQRLLLGAGTDNFVKICPGNNFQVFLLDAGHQLWQADTRTQKIEKIQGIGVNGVLTETVNKLFTDRENNLWIALEDGVIKASKQRISFLDKKHGIHSLPVQAVATMGNTILAAGPKAITLLQNDKVTGVYEYAGSALSNPRQRIRDIRANDKGHVWVLSSSQGLWHTTDGKNWEQLGNTTDISAFAVTEDDKILATRPDGLYSLLPGNEQKITALPAFVKPHNIWYSDNNLMLLTNKGLYKLNGNNWNKIKLEKGEDLDVQVYAINKVYENLSLVGTAKGIFYLKDQHLVRYSLDSNWGTRPYYGIAVDQNGAVWLAADTGLVLMDKKGAPKIFAFPNLKFKENNLCPIVAGADGKIWVSMRTGLMLYSPLIETQQVGKPLVQITGVESQLVTHNTGTNSQYEIKLGSEDNDLTFYFDANSFIDESKNKLLYKLEGYMNEWEEITNFTSNSISFKNLNPGKYVLKMQLINANGLAGEIVSSAIISIKKPFYNQWWFYAAAIGLFFAISFAVFYVYGQKKFEKDLLQEVEKRSRELRSSEDRFRTIWENTSDALALYNLKGDLIIYNQAFLAILGKTENISGRKLYEVLNISDGEIPKDLFKQNLEVKQLKTRFELKTLQGNNEVVLEFSNTNLLLPNEKTWVMLSIIRNITRQKQTEENLIRAKNEAEQASRIKSAFLATMSHEIRTPLNAIIGMSSVMRNTRLSDEQRNYISAIKTSSDSLLSLVNNILDFSKIEAGMMMIEKVTVDIEECVTETLEILGNLANERGIFLYYRIHPDVAKTIISDKTRLRQVLINLVGNAIKFTDKGYIEISVKPDSNHHIKISVTDTGIGIPQNKINTLFKVFTQVDDTTTRKYGGTGLGLAITEKLVNLLGGFIKVASNQGKGSQFTFTIKDFSQGKNKTLRGETIDKFAGLKVALLSRQVGVQNIFKSLNEERGIQTLLATTMAQAIQLLPEITVLLVDTMEPITEISLDKNIDVSKIYLIKRQLQPLSTETKLLFPDGDKRAINIPITTEIYGQIISKILKPTPTDKSNVTSTEIKTIKLGVSVPLDILVVDDNKVNLMMMEVILKNLGYKVDFANNGKEAVDQVMTKSYHLVFMDLQMPEMDGIEATKEIKKQLNDLAPAIVALTANAFPEDKQACLDAGMIDFLPKPVTMDTIKGLIIKYFASVDEPVV